VGGDKGEGEMKHFNSGNVWGRVANCKLQKSDQGTPYLQIQFECSNELFGNIKTYGRLWGQDKIDAFIDYFKKHPGQSFRFKGFFSQYDKEEGQRYSNYTFFEWQPVDGKEFRAAFVLTGEVTAVEEVNGEGKIYLHLLREGRGEYRDIEEDFEVYTLNVQEIAGINEGDILQVKGVMRAKEPEDYFGMPSGEIKPYVSELKLMGRVRD